MGRRMDGCLDGWLGGRMDGSHFTTLWSLWSLDLLSPLGYPPLKILRHHYPASLSQGPTGNYIRSVLNGCCELIDKKRKPPASRWSLIFGKRTLLEPQHQLQALNIDTQTHMPVSALEPHDTGSQGLPDLELSPLIDKGFNWNSEQSHDVSEVRRG